MSLTLLPAVDVAGGRAVGLARGGGGTSEGDTGVDGDPRATALAWQADGAEWIHLVDLDAAFGRGSNAALVGSVVGAVDVAVELAGGIVDDASLERALATGCARVSLGAAALADPAWCARMVAEHGERVAISLDVLVEPAADGGRRHRLVPRGSSVDHGDLWEALDRLAQEGCARVIVTDVGRDGSLRGPNVGLCEAVAAATTVPVIASGGISSIQDLVALADVGASGAPLEGAIVGKALYAGRFTLAEAIDAVRRADEASRPGA